MSNLDKATVDGFGQEWKRYPQDSLSGEEHAEIFEQYFGIFPWDKLPASPRGFDAGCGSGRWAKLVIGRVGELHCVDAAAEALAVAQRNLEGKSNARFYHASIDAMPFPDGSMDFGYSLGVLHHMPDTAGGLKACAAKLKPGAPFLVYLYYDFENRPWWFRALWKASDALRKGVSKLPFGLKHLVCLSFAASVYWPLARAARLAELAGKDISHFPLSYYRQRSFYTMRTDALDRFGTRLEQRFSSYQVRAMMEAAGLRDVVFSPRMPHWCAVGYKH